MTEYFCVRNCVLMSPLMTEMCHVICTIWCLWLNVYACMYVCIYVCMYSFKFCYSCKQRRTKMKWGPQAKLIDEALLKDYFVIISLLPRYICIQHTKSTKQII